MPCQLTPEEIRWEEERHNKENFGLDMTDRRLLEEVACQACRRLEECGRMDRASELVKKWWRLHKKEDEVRNKQREQAEEAAKAEEIATLKRLMEKHPDVKRKKREKK